MVPIAIISQQRNLFECVGKEQTSAQPQINNERAQEKKKQEEKNKRDDEKGCAATSRRIIESFLFF